MSLGLVVLEEKLFTRTQTRMPTPQSDDIKTVNNLSECVEIVNNPMEFPSNIYVKNVHWDCMF